MKRPSDSIEAGNLTDPFTVWRYIPGIALPTGIALFALCVQEVTHSPLLSPLMLSTIVGIAIRCLAGPMRNTLPGIGFMTKRVSRLAIVLLGTQISLSQLAELGYRGAAIVVAVLIATFLATDWVGRAMGVNPKLARLIAAGTSICGASAIVATNEITEASEEEVAAALTFVTLFGCAGALLYPGMALLFSLDGYHYGLWAGASLHELAQVVAAAIPRGSEASSFATIAKLLRISMLAPMILVLAYVPSNRNQKIAGGQSRAKPPLPWFAVGLLVVISLNSLGMVPIYVSGYAHETVFALLSASLAALGLSIHPNAIARRGAPAFVLTGIASLFIAVMSLLLITSLT